MVQGLTRHAAYAAAGYVSENAKSASAQISKLLHLPEIRFRIHWLQIRQAARLNVTIDKLVLELQDAWDEARILGNPAAMIAATMAKAKLLGYLNEEERKDGHLPKPSPIPTDVVELSESEWIDTFKPKVLQ